MSDTQPKIAIRTTSRALSTEYDVMFDRPVDSPNEHQEELYVMRQAAEGDVVNMRINTDGGRISTASAVHGIINKSQAHFHAILESDASSAGSMLFLMADSQEVYPMATMYIHTCQSGMGGHSQEMKAYGKFIGELSEKLVKEIYKDFLSEEEMLKVLDGGVVWLQSDEIKERLEKREAIRQQHAVEEAKETYTPEVYATQCVMDITEDCESFKYDAVEIITKMLEEAKAAAEPVEEEFPDNVSELEGTNFELEVKPDGVVSLTFEEGVYKLEVRSDGNLNDFSDEPLFTSFKEIVANGDIGLTDLKGWAKALGVKFAHNISESTLVKRVDDKIAEIRETLVD